ncbi:MAG: two-component system sensor histidine kinase NtrB [Candidatus Binataceae bacterium]
MKSVRACGCSRDANSTARHIPSDATIQASPDELETIRQQLATIERLLARLFGVVYCREPDCLEARAEAAEVIENHFDGIVSEWSAAISSIFGDPFGAESVTRRIPDLANSLARFVAHLRDPDDLTTYVYLRRHCQEGMLARAEPSQFNTIHIALKQIILRHVRAAAQGTRSETLRDIVVAAIDERRLMVSQFYIESRERQLRASEEKYRNSIDHAPDPMYEIDADSFRVTGVNAAARDMWKGESPDHPPSPVGLKLTEMVPPEMQPITHKHLQTVIQQGTHHALDLPIGPRFFDVHSALISFGSQRFIQMILHDVTQRRQMLDELLKAERLAATGTFAAGVAHEVNNPLASISSLVQSLLSGENDSNRQTTLHTILSQITRISGTLKDLVNFARPSTTQRKAVNLNDLINETLRLVSYNRRISAIRIERELASDLRPAYADDNEIQQVLLNLLFNAADANSGEGSRIRVVTENLPDRRNGGSTGGVALRIIDNGVGIPPENLNRVFDPFFTTKPAGSGVGLGLSLCQRIILSNRGSIRVESEVGKGTAVTIALPSAEAEPQTQLASPVSA